MQAKPDDDSYEEDEEEEIVSDIQPNFKQLFKTQDQFMDKINQLNQQATIYLKQKKTKEALKLLQQSESMLEYAASCGKIIDRNLIIVILYNQACAYQIPWILDKCAKYLDGVIYNLEIAIKEDEADVQNLASAQEKEAQLVKRQSFLIRSYLQYTAILSQLGKHKQALSNAKKAAQIMRDQFKISNEFCKEWIKKNGSQGTATTNSSARSKKDDQENNRKKQVFYMKDEVEFAKLIIEGSKDILSDMNQQVELEQLPMNEKQALKEAKRQLYFWRNNPENNEKHLRKELKIQVKEEEQRSILGVQNVSDWIKDFNIGTIMHMNPQTFTEFCEYGEMIYEISKRVLLEKVIYLSISYFTIATELRFIELDKAKITGLKDKDIQTEEFKLSEFYHLKAIEIACKHINCYSPYINHLIVSYHKHYNSDLESIQEESIVSTQSELNFKEERQQKFKQNQMQTQKDNAILLKQLNEQRLQNDQSPASKLINSFLNQPSPLKSNRNISDNVRPNIIEQMIQNKKRAQIPSDMSPSHLQRAYEQANTSAEKIKDLSQILRKQTFNDITSNMPIQLQPYKSSAKYNLANLIKSPQSTQQMKTFIFENCRTERQTQFSPFQARTQNRSPDQSSVHTNRSKITQNKTPNSRLRTNTEQQQQASSIKIRNHPIIAKGQNKLIKGVAKMKHSSNK